MKSTDVSHKQKGGCLPSRLKLRLLRRDCAIERFDCPVSRTAEVCKVCCHLPTSGTQTCPFSEPSLLGYRAGVIKKIWVCVEVLMCVRGSPGRRAVASAPLRGGWELAMGMPARCLGLWGTWELQRVWQRGRARQGQTGREV